MNRIAKYLSAVLLVLSVAACATDSMHSAPTMMSGGMMVNSTGMTLYTFDKDTANSGKSACNGPCAALWPAVTASSGMMGGDYSVITRDDGSQQLTYKGKPLYLYAKDQKPGDMTGDNFKGIWHVVK
jgi:predicted lipoprotein with Yx(FWY)xxD motif